MASSKAKRAPTSEVDCGWDLSARVKSSPPALSVFERSSDREGAEEKPPAESQPRALDDGWSIEQELRPRAPRLEVVGKESTAIPVPIYDDGWTISPDRASPGKVETKLRLSTNAEEEAFFAAGDQLGEESEPPDSFEDLAEDRGGFWQRLLSWWRAGAAAGRRKR